jgi:uncharacterized membrane protein YbhN (UPF0104 family)
LKEVRVRKAAWRWTRVLVGAGILAVLVRHVGAGPFVDGVRAVDRGALIVAFAIGAVTTMACAWRWRLITHALGGRLPGGTAVGAYYRSQLLNLTLPGGVIGDVHRAVRHGLDIGDVGLAVRAAVWDRMAGQAVQVVAALAVLSVLPSPVRTHVPLLALILASAAALVAVSVARAARDGSTRWGRVLGTVRADVRTGLLARGRWVGVLLSSIVVIAGHVGTFVIAARTAGSTAATIVLVPLAVLVLLAMSVPLSVAGWGPREGVAAWAFAAAGLTAAAGVATAVTYGVLVLFASLPGAVVLLAGWLTRPSVLGRGPTLAPSGAAQPIVRSGSHG